MIVRINNINRVAFVIDMQCFVCEEISFRRLCQGICVQQDDVRF
jgi:hypothetical protein